jgi:REP element-mobilizing transposase RayT
MIHAYHAIFGTYGFWLPNDPRGSWSDFVGAWELARKRRSTKSINLDGQWMPAKKGRPVERKSLKLPHVQFTGRQTRAVARGFALGVEKCDLTVWACSILTGHVHLVVARHRYGVEQIVNLLKGEATKQLKRERLHPFMDFAAPDGQIPSAWARRGWNVFLDSEEAIDEAIHYVEQNPVKEGRRRQNWSFVTPFAGLEKGWTTYF